MIQSRVDACQLEWRGLCCLIPAFFKVVDTFFSFKQPVFLPA